MVTVANSHELEQFAIATYPRVLGPTHTGRVTMHTDRSLLLGNGIHRNTGIFTLQI